MEALTRRATMLRDSLQRSQGNTDGMVAILGSFDHRLSALEAAMRPTQVSRPLPLTLLPVRFPQKAIS
jgi:exocyst complex protein 7